MPSFKDTDSNNVMLEDRCTAFFLPAVERPQHTRDDQRIPPQIAHGTSVVKQHALPYRDLKLLFR
jgi:hypothetical protein